MEEMRYANRFSVAVHSITGETIISFAQSFQVEPEKAGENPSLETIDLTRIVLNQATAHELVTVLANCLGLNPPTERDGGDES